jgi:predicted alpha/beta-hydrolase family hydrolase
MAGMSGSPTRFEVEVGGAPSSGLRYEARDPRATLVLAHGAGAPQSHPWMVAMVRTIASEGLDVVTFDFLYTHAKRRVPDRPDVLEATWRAVYAAVQGQENAPRPLFVGGKSMGGRIATQVAAQGGFKDLSGIVLLGYPLHPPGRPDKLRTAHLPKVTVPMLFVQGSRDIFGSPTELAPFVDPLPAGGRIFPIEGGDHSLTPPRRGGESLPTVMDRVAGEIVRFVGECSSGA